MDSPSSTATTRLRAAQRLLLLLVAIAATLVGTTTVASARTASQLGSPSRITVAPAAETRVGVATLPAPVFVGSQRPANPAGIGRIGCVYDKTASASCVATETGIKPCNSFVPETRVLMADGSSKPIAEVTIGDRVLATDPVTGATEAHEVVDLITGEGEKHLVDVKIRTKDGVRTIVATENHPFYVDDRGVWLPAGLLHAGDELRGPDGSELKIVGLHKHAEFLKVHNLSVEGVHTYYVLAGDQAVLVHNQNRAPGVGPKTGVIYVRTDPVSGKQYVGQANSWDRFQARIGEHNAKLPNGQQYKFEVLERNVAVGDLDMLEESYIRAGGGPGALENGRWQIGSEAEYQALGGTCPR